MVRRMKYAYAYVCIKLMGRYMTIDCNESISKS